VKKVSVQNRDANLGHQREKSAFGMNQSTTIKILGAGVLLVLVLPLFVFPLFATAQAKMGGCHGHHDSTPIHSCCYVRPQAPAHIQVIPRAAGMQILAGDLAPSEVKAGDIALLMSWHADPSPPPPVILRI